MKKIFALGLTALLTVGVTACGTSENTTSTDTNSPVNVSDNSQVEEKVETLKFGVVPGTIRTALVLLADELGFYEEEGVNVEFTEVADAPSALTAISTGKSEIDIWGTGIVPNLNFIANGSDLVIFEGTAAEGGAIIATPENVDIYKDFTNYEGITIATVRADSAWVVSRNYLKEQGIDVDSIKVLEVDSQVNVAEAVKKGEASLGFLPTEFASKYHEIGIVVVYEVGELDPLYVCCRQVTSRQVYEEKADALEKFTIANLRAYDFYYKEENRAGIVKYLAEYSGQTEEYVDNYLFVNRTVLTLDPNKNGVIEYYDALVDSGYYDAEVDLTKHIDTTVYKNALDAIAKREPDNETFKELQEVYRNNN
ncbi:MAG: ABC transporter substrate-binding protein [Clostridiales bacterium]|nr:ABC transporter substrate-binding protein [Clostridiales bacterium]